MRGQLTRFVLCILALTLPAWCAAGELSHASRDLEALAEPRHGAKAIWKVPKDSIVELVQRQNAWAEISSGNQQGWVLFFFLKPGEPEKQNIGKEIGGVLGLAATRQSGQVTAVIGVRGITEEQLKAAKFNEEELRKLESLTVAPGAASSFADSAGLQSWEVNYLPAPEGTLPDRRSESRD